jgi:hypothetical protein
MSISSTEAALCNILPPTKVRSSVNVRKPSTWCSRFLWEYRWGGCPTSLLVTPETPAKGVVNPVQEVKKQRIIAILRRLEASFFLGISEFGDLIAIFS